MSNILPHYAVDRAIRAGYGQQYASAATRLGHVKQGKVAHLPDLVALVEAAMSEYARARRRSSRPDSSPDSLIFHSHLPCSRLLCI